MVVVEGVKYPTPCKKRGEIVQGKLTREIRLEKEYVQGRGECPDPSLPAYLHVTALL